MHHGESKLSIPKPLVGLGLRHAHYSDALTSVAPIDFVELHSENYFAPGGAIKAVLQDIVETYPVSLHSTSLGLGSAEIPRNANLNFLIALVNQVQPILVSDHASFSWGSWSKKPVHAGDLLPLSFNHQALNILAKNVDMVQQALGRQILLENLSSYISFSSDTMSEAEFLVRLTEKTGCGLLLDLNNIIVSAHNLNEPDIASYALNWIRQLPEDVIGEIHLAGFTEANPDDLVVDDHSQKVSRQCWILYAEALGRFGAVPTLIEWDNNLPEWDVLLREVETARMVAEMALSHSSEDIACMI